MVTPHDAAALERWLATCLPPVGQEDPLEAFAAQLLWATCLRMLAEAQQALRQRPRDASYN